MDKLDEVKKLKKLLDDGIIDEEDFKKKKAQLLGLSKEEIKEVKEEVVEEPKTEKKESESKSLDDYEKELLEQSDIEESKEEKSDTKANNDYYQKEKLKARAKLDAEEEIRNKRKAETKAAVDKGATKVKNVIKWILAIFLWIFGIASVCTAFDSGWVYIPLGLIMILQGCMACPKITEKAQKFETYTMHKTIIVIITVVLWVILACVFPTNNNNNDSNSNNSNTVQEKSN